MNCDPRFNFHVELWPGSKFHVELWARVRSQHWIVIPFPGNNLSLNHDSWSHFNVELRPGSKFNVESRPWIKIQRGIMNRVKFQREILTRVINQRWIMTRGHISTNVELRPCVRIQHWIMIPIPVYNLTLNHDSGSKFNMEFSHGVIIQRGIKTRGHNSTGVKILSIAGVVKQWPPISGGGGGRNSTWKIRWILSTAHWLKTPQVEIQWGQWRIYLSAYTIGPGLLLIWQFYSEIARRFSRKLNSNTDTSFNALNGHSGSFMVVTGILFNNMNYLSLTNVKWHSDHTDKTFH